jgi:hypothetical protein
MDSSSQYPESAESGEWVFGGKLRRMPAPETANWLELYGSWDGFMEVVHESIGGRRSRGVLRFAKSAGSMEQGAGSRGKGGRMKCEG